MFGAHRPVLQNDPEDKMPLIPVLLGSQATPAVPMKKEESGVPEPVNASLPKPPAAGSTAASSGQQPPTCSPAMRQKPPLPRLPTDAGNAVTAIADGAAADRTTAEDNGARALSSEAGGSQVEAAGKLHRPAPEVDAEGGAAEEDERLREDLGEATAPESPVQYSRDPWAHDPWWASPRPSPHPMHGNA